ncbi:MAG: hypothetical protein DRR16_14020 [Candidatus Parabeggiatoa sp. nov. 3]|nr:MAG: hypothetical protein DRR00_21895 [Gammaproteobacteria bacterium]RKZ84696.1 MAG: hypothetical protein DRR16_14020 [Gammaproteobacteria bacterium]
MADNIWKKISIYSVCYKQYPQRSTIEKLKLIQALTTQIESDLKVTQPAPRQSKRGLWRGLEISETEMAEARNEMWGNFPRVPI